MKMVCRYFCAPVCNKSCPHYGVHDHVSRCVSGGGCTKVGHHVNCIPASEDNIKPNDIPDKVEV